jgi:hypothetical protein
MTVQQRRTLSNRDRKRPKANDKDLGECVCDARVCEVCDAPITACMGFSLARDIVEIMEGRKPVLGYIREFCGKCVDFVNPAEINP